MYQKMYFKLDKWNIIWLYLGQKVLRPAIQDALVYPIRGNSANTGKVSFQYCLSMQKAHILQTQGNIIQHFFKIIQPALVYQADFIKFLLLLNRNILKKFYYFNLFVL